MNSRGCLSVRSQREESTADMHGFGRFRVEHRLRHVNPGTHGAHKLPPTHYPRENFYLTTSGVFRTSALLDAMLEVGSDRILFSLDYPYQSVAEHASWFDACPISERDREKIGRSNARALFKLDAPSRT